MPVGYAIDSAIVLCGSLNEQKPVLASWEDEEEEEEVAPSPAKTESAAPKGPLKPKQIKKQKLKEQEEKRKLEIAITKARLAEQANETEAERKAREKASIEEADFELALDAFASAPKPASGSVPSGGDGDIESVVAGMRLVSLADHEKLGDAVSARLSASNSKYALECMKVILTKASVNLTADDMKDLTTVLNVIKNEKIAAAKPKGKKKKQTGKQGYANVERTVSTGGAGGKNYANDDYDNFDDYDDFM